MRPVNRKLALWTGFCTFVALYFCVYAGAQTENILYTFTGSNGDGAHPQAGLMMDASGNLYGTTFLGGSPNVGTVFELVNSSGTYSENLLYTFTTSNGDSQDPHSALIMDSSGNLYGTTAAGGSSGLGSVFELVNSSGSYSEKVLYSFTNFNGDGAQPFSAVVMDSAGNLYGTTNNGGKFGAGTVFELVNSSGVYSEKVLYSFTNSNGDGANPYGGLVMDSSGNLYGATTAGGQGGRGVVFGLFSSQGTYIEKVLYSFTSNGDGANPYGALVMDSTGNLYGTTYGGGSGFGTVFELGYISGKYTEKVLYSFTNSNGDGANPYAGLTMDPSGNLYGTTFFGGSSGAGTVFELVNSSGSYNEKVLYSFTGSNGDGASPFAGVIIDSSGTLYGTTTAGGSGGPGGNGIVFSTPNFSGPPSPTTTTVGSSQNPATAGNPVTVTATVTSSAGNVTSGTVTFSEGPVTLGTAALNSGTATLTISDAAALGIGTYTISAQFSGNSVFAPSTGTLNQAIAEAGVVLTSGNNTLTGNETINGNVNATTFAGNGSALTNVSAAGISCTGCIGNIQLGVNYAGSSSQGGDASNALMLGGLFPSAFQPAGSYATLGANLFSGAQSITGNVSVTGNSSTTGTTTLGTGGTPIVEHLSKLFTPTFTLGTGACTSQVFPFTGVSNGDTVALGVPNQRMSVGDVIYTAWVSASNKVTIKVCAFATKPANLGSGSVRVDVWKH